MLEKPKDGFEPLNNGLSQPPPPPTPLPPPAEPTHAQPERKRGRKLHEHRIEDMKKIIAFIEQKGEATPGEIEEQLGIARSTLTYYMKQFLEHPNRAQDEHYLIWDNTGRTVGYCLSGKTIERLGAGRSVRYRVIGKP